MGIDICDFLYFIKPCEYLFSQREKIYRSLANDIAMKSGIPYAETESRIAIHFLSGMVSYKVFKRNSFFPMPVILCHHAHERVGVVCSLVVAAAVFDAVQRSSLTNTGQFYTQRDRERKTQKTTLSLSNGIVMVVLLLLLLFVRPTSSWRIQLHTGKTGSITHVRWNMKNIQSIVGFSLNNT